MPQNIVIELDGVSKSFDGGQTLAVNDLSFQVAKGELLTLLGGSGCGKSTTIKMINRLIEPTSGTIRIAGDDITKRDPTKLRRKIGYVFQAIGLFPHMTVAENVSVIPKLLGQKETDYHDKVRDLMQMVDLPPSEFADRYPDQLSGGQKQRVGFARALAGDAKVMLLDEPFGALDPVTRDNVQTEFKNIHRKLGLTAVMVTHDMAEALLLADRIAVMQDGKIIRSGTPRELLHNPEHDYVAQLLETPRRHGKLIQSLEN